MTSKVSSSAMEGHYHITLFHNSCYKFLQKIKTYICTKTKQKKKDFHALKSVKKAAIIKDPI